MLNPGAHIRFHLLRRQLGRNLGIDHDPANHIDQVQEGQEKAREHGGGVELHHRLAGHGCVHNDHHRRRDQNTQRAPGGDHASGQAGVIAGVQHRAHGDHAHQHHHSAHQATGNAPEGADHQGGHGQRAGQAAEGQLHAVEHFVHQRAALHDVAHQHKERNRQQSVVGHGAKGALHHQVEHAVVHPRLGRVVERGEAKHHAQTHQGEGGGEAHHDDHDDEPQHQEAECGIAHR